LATLAARRGVARDFAIFERAPAFFFAAAVDRVLGFVFVFARAIFLLRQQVRVKLT
jgi:hypothetical protein